MKAILQQLAEALAILVGPWIRWQPVYRLAGAHPHLVPKRHASPLRYLNTGGPRSRVVSSHVVSNLLEHESPELGIRRLDEYVLRYGEWKGSLRDLVRNTLGTLGFRSPEEAWEAMRDELPARRAIAHGGQLDRWETSSEDESRELLRNALVLGRCCCSLFNPDRPLILSERRLSRRVQLIDLDAETFTRGDGDE